MPNNYLSVLYKHIIQVENKNVGLKVCVCVCVGGGGAQAYHCHPPPHTHTHTPASYVSVYITEKKILDVIIFRANSLREHTLLYDPDYCFELPICKECVDDCFTEVSPLGVFCISATSAFKQPAKYNRSKRN